MNRVMSQGQAIRSIFGRSRVTHFIPVLQMFVHAEVEMWRLPTSCPAARPPQMTAGRTGDDRLAAVGSSLADHPIALQLAEVRRHAAPLHWVIGDAGGDHDRD